MRAPEPLTAAHDLAAFDCGNPVMNAWLNERAHKNQEDGATRTFVVCDDGSNRVRGYYALAVDQAARTEAPSIVSRADPIAMMVLARLAVDKHAQGIGLGRQLVADAVLRTLRVSMDAGIRGILVSAIDEQARTFYEKLGFVRSRTQADVLMLRLKVAAEVLGAG